MHPAVRVWVDYLTSRARIALLVERSRAPDVSSEEPVGAVRSSGPGNVIRSFRTASRRALAAIRTTDHLVTANSRLLGSVRSVNTGRKLTPFHRSKTDPPSRVTDRAT